jgi:hypothetical protein
MPVDKYPERFGDLCLQCGTEERQPNRTWCPSCIARPRKARLAYLDQVAREEMAWIPHDRRTPPAPAPVANPGERPTRLCHRCGVHRWQVGSDGAWHCGVCGVFA